MGLVDQAERALPRRPSTADPRNSIAVVGLARVALGARRRPDGAPSAAQALEIDPENAAAIRLAARLEEVIRHRETAEADAGSDVGADARADAGAGARAEPAPEPQADRRLRLVRPRPMPTPARRPTAVPPPPSPGSRHR